MLQIWNKTPFSAGLSLFCDPSGADVVAIAVKATYALPSGGEPCRLSGEQLPVLYRDEYRGAPAESSIARPPDVVLGKAGTDIGLVGRALAPAGRAVARLDVVLAVAQLRKTITVFGDRRWEKSLGSGKLRPSAPAPFVEMPIVHERAFGGQDQGPEGRPLVDARNPVGTGFLLDAHRAPGRALPNLEDPDRLIAEWNDRPPVACFGFVDAWWQRRRAHAGTYDEAWRRDHFPLLPRDFDLRFFNQAEEGLVSPRFLNGGEPVQLVNLSERGTLAFRLPEVAVDLSYRLGEEEHPARARLQTVVFEPDNERFYLVWGDSFPVGKQPSRLRYVRVEATGPSVAGARGVSL
ncbi:MAG TPA: DUF2169 domain-containing protein [Polyangia bacterium]|nr:DUF2169 domain-containing protein [Polyangia bacterium]